MELSSAAIGATTQLTQRWRMASGICGCCCIGPSRVLRVGRATLSIRYDGQPGSCHKCGSLDHSPSECHIYRSPERGDAPNAPTHQARDSSTKSPHLGQTLLWRFRLHSPCLTRSSLPWPNASGPRGLPSSRTSSHTSTHSARHPSPPKGNPRRVKEHHWGGGALSPSGVRDLSRR